MRRVFTVLTAAAVVLTGAPASAKDLQPAPTVAPGLLQEQASGAATASSRATTYIVQLIDDPAIAYEGKIPGYARTKPMRGQKYDSRSSQAMQYTAHLRGKQDKILRSVGAQSRKVYSYVHAFNGFAARLTPAEAEKLRASKEVLSVWEDRAVDVETNNSPQFLGLLDPREGLRERLHLKGEGVVIGVIDSGIVQEHPSFADTETLPLPAFCADGGGSKKAQCDELRAKLTRVVYDPPQDWYGECVPGEAFAASDCNNKLIGARYYVDGFLNGAGAIVDDEFLSARDASGHGTHTASTAGGNEGVVASLGGTPLTTISGMAPRARIAAYKACWLAPGATNFSCFFSDSAAATDDAVADGVDVINFSVGTAAAFNDPQDIAFLFAADAGVFVARSAGNSGPGFATTAAGEPWVTSVGASTLSGTGYALAARINAPASVAGDYAALEGAITGSLTELGPVTADVGAAQPIEACGPLANDLTGKIALIARGVCAFTTKIEAAAAAGASGVLMYTDARPKTVMGGTATALTRSIPGVMVDNDVGLALKDEIDGGATVNATLAAGIYITEPLTGNIMADFSSRGPFPTETDWIKPDITAPGVRILAGYTPEPADGSAGGFFSYLQGTSMSSPHIAGLAALIKEAHPDWSPAAIKSALMTSARQDVVKEDGATPADPFDFGAGHVDPNQAVDPGLVYDAGFLDYLAASCGTVSPLVSSGLCDLLASLGFSLDPADLNLPSIGIGELPGTQTITRRVTNVAKRGRVDVTVQVEVPEGFRVEVSPSRLFLKSGETAEYQVTISNETAPPGEWRFGSLTWVDANKEYSVRSPIAVNAKALVAPLEVAGAGAEGSTQFDVTFGYTGSYAAGVHGLAEPALIGPLSLADDSDNTFQFCFPSCEGTVAAYLAEVPPGTAYVRWSTFDEYTTGNDDLDLYVYYCPNFSCSQVATSLNATSDEEVSIALPANDPAIPDPYLVFVHAFNTEGGAPTTAVLFNWEFGLVDDRGNMTVDAPSSAALGQTETLTVDWSGLPTGPGEKQLGAISHSGDAGLLDLTIINIQNDAGFGICDFGLCGP